MSGPESTPVATDLFAVLGEVTSAVASSADVDETLRLIARSLGEALAVSECRLYEHAGDGDDRLTPVAIWEAGPAAGTGERVDDLTDDRADDPALSPADDSAPDPLDPEARSALARLTTPLVFGDEVIGRLDLVADGAGRRFTEHEKEIAATFAVPAAVALHEVRTRRREADQQRFLSSLVGASRAFTQTEALDDVLDRIAREAAEALDVAQAAVYEYDPEEQALVYRVLCERERSIGPDDSLGSSYALDDYPGERQILMSDGIVTELLSDPDLPNDRRGCMETWGEKSVLSVPLRFHDRRLGILRVYAFDRERVFTEVEHRLAAGLGELASAAIHNARAYRAQADRTRQLASLLDASTAITATVVLEDVLELVARKTAEALGSQQCVIYEYLKERDAIATRSLYNRSDRPQDDGVDEIGTVFSLDLYPSDRVLLRKGEIVQQHLGDTGLPRDVRETMDAFGEKACLNVPLLFRGEALGILVLVEFDHERYYTPEEIGLAAGLSEQAATAIHHARLYRQQEEKNRLLVTLLDVSRRIAASLDAHTVLREVAAGVSRLFADEAATARVWRRAGDGRFEPADHRDAGVADNGDDELVARVLEGGEALQEDLGADGQRVILPLVVHGALTGYVEVRSGRSDPLTEDDLQVLQVLASEATVALENADNYAKLEDTYLQTVTALAAAMEAKDQYTADHADMLANMAVAIGRRLGLPEAELRDLQYAAVLHDIGKIGIPGAILNKPDQLTDEEFAVMAEHTVIGERIISQIAHLRSIGHIVRAAHERWDGKGYPDGLGGEAIPLSSRILLVCDAYHAMTSDRPYRKALAEDVALGELQRNAGTQFDPAVVDRFVETWPHFETEYCATVN